MAPEGWVLSEGWLGHGCGPGESEDAGGSAVSFATAAQSKSSSDPALHSARAAPLAASGTGMMIGRRG